MPKGPQGQKRPADTVSAAIRVARIATGEEQEDPPVDLSHVERGKKGGRARADKLSDAEKQRIAKKAAESRWRSKNE